MTTETWRVVAEGGDVREMTPEACPQADGTVRWTVGGAGSHATQRGAVLMACVSMKCAAVEIRGPGELTTAERVAAMRERCAVAAGDVATRAKALALHHGAQWNADGAVHAAAESTGATHAADAIRALPLEVPRG